MAARRVIVLGGGFAGVKCAKTLRKVLPQDEWDVIVFNRENHMTFHPLLAELAAGAIGVRDVAAPLRQLLPGVQCRSQDVIAIHPDSGEIEFEGVEGQLERMRYDHLVVACGSAVNLSLIEGMDDHAFPLKTVGDALALQGQIIEQMEKAEVCQDPDRRRWYLSFIVVGGGFSGVEVAGEINDLVRMNCKYFHNMKAEDISVTVIDAREQILPEVSPALRDFAAKKMVEAGVTIIPQAQAAFATPEGVGLRDGRLIRGGTIVCTIGNSPSPLISKLKLPKRNGRLETKEDMSIPGYPNLWAIGDCAAIVNAYDGALSPPVGQFAERQGAQAAANIAARVKGASTRPFHFRMLGHLCSIGDRNAVAEIMGIKLSGFPAWFLWRGVYLLKLPTFAQTVKVAVKWGLELLFPRSMPHLKNDRTRRIAKAHFESGDMIFRCGEPATDFYAITSGEVEILKHVDLGSSEDGQDEGIREELVEPVAILGPGDFFGESALTNNRPRRNSARARTDVEVVLLGRNVFTQISSALAPLSEAMAEAMRRRTSIWSQLPEVREIVDEIPMERFIEPLQSDPLYPDSVLPKVVKRINRNRLDFCCVVDEKQHLVGLVTRTDLLRAMEVAAASPEKQRLMCAADIMVRDPIALTPADSTAFAISTMREHGLKRLPVVRSQDDRRLKGYVRIESIMEVVLSMMKQREGTAAGVTGR